MIDLIEQTKTLDQERKFKFLVKVAGQLVVVVDNLTSESLLAVGNEIVSKLSNVSGVRLKSTTCH